MVAVKNWKPAIFLMLFLPVLATASIDGEGNVYPSRVTMYTETAMHDSAGHVIRDCQQPHIAQFGDTWYAYGFDRHPLAGTPSHTTCYSTKDFKTWVFEDTLFTYPQDQTVSGNVLYNAKTNEYVFIGQVYGTKALVYTGPTPKGPFTYKNDMTNTLGGVADYSVYADTDGKAYLIYSRYAGAIPERYAYIYQLNDDYDNIVPSTFCNTNTVMEGFWMAKHQGTYFLMGSGLVGCDVDDNFYITAKSPLGPWTYRGYFVPPGSKTFHSQTFMGLQISGSKGTANIFIGQVANCTNAGRSIWLPLSFSSDTTIETLRWVDNWTLDTAGEMGYQVDSTFVQWVDDKSPSVRFSGSWFSESHASCYGGSEQYSKTAGDDVEFGFRGNAVSWIGTVYPNRGKANVYIDGVLDSAGIDLYSGGLVYQHVHYSKTWTTQDTHTIRIVVTGTHHTSSSDNFLSVDAFSYHRTYSTESQASKIATAEPVLKVYPNPFNPDCNISLNVKKAQKVELSIYDVAGHRIYNLIQQNHQERNRFQCIWNGRGEQGMIAASGIYLVKVVANGKTYQKSVVLTR